MLERTTAAAELAVELTALVAQGKTVHVRVGSLAGQRVCGACVLSLHLNEIDCRTVSSSEATKDAERSSTNLYSMFWIKSRCPRPPRCITNTARCECGCCVFTGYRLRLKLA